MPNYSGSWNLVQQMQAVAASNWPIQPVQPGTVAIFALGFVCGVGSSSTRNKYTYSGCVNASATAATAASSRGSAASNGTTGVNV